MDNQTTIPDKLKKRTTMEQHLLDDSSNSEVGSDLASGSDSSMSSTSGLEAVSFTDEEQELIGLPADLTLSSDVTTEEANDPGLFEQLHAPSMDMLLDCEQTVQGEESYGRLSDKVSQYEDKWSELETILEETCESPSVSEYAQMEQESTITSLRIALKQEQQKRMAAAMCFDRICRQLKKTEDRYRTEVEKRQKMEMAMQNMELEITELGNNKKQLEEDRDMAQHLLMEERNNNLRLQKELEEENRRNLSQINETTLQLKEASNRERELLEQTVTLQDEIAVLKLELERERASKKQEDERQSEASKALTERLEDMRKDLQLSEEVLAQTISRYNNQVTNLKAKLTSTSKMAESLSELEREKQELRSEMEVEKNKSMMMAKLKEEADVRLGKEMQRNTELQTEVLKLRKQVKSAKKKLREQESRESHRHLEIEATISKMQSDIDELCLQRQTEALEKSKVEAKNRDLEEQLSSLKTLSKRYKRAKKSKNQLKEEVKNLKEQMETWRLEQLQTNKDCKEAEERQHKELQRKLEEVSYFLYAQAASQESQEHARVANEASMRSHLEQRIQELEGELGRARSREQDSLCERDCARIEMQYYRDLYNEEQRLCGILAAKLERSNERLEEANSRHQHSMYLLTSSIMNSSNADF